MRCKKTPFSSRKDATAVKDEKYGKPYMCPICGHWHLGHRVSKKESRQYLRYKRAFKELMDMIDIFCGVK